MILIFFLISQYRFLPAVRVNDDPPGQAFHTTISSGQHCIAARGDTIYLAYRGDQTGQANIYFSKSTDGGRTWSPSIRVNYPNPGIFQTLAVSKNGHIFIAYDDRGPTNDVYFTKSTNGGISFTTPIRVNDIIEGVQKRPSIAVDSSGNKVFIAWDDIDNIYFARSTDGGNSFSPSIRVNDSTLNWQIYPSICANENGETIYCVWQDRRNNNDYDIYFAKSVDGGISFERNVLVNDTDGLSGVDQELPSIAVDKKGWIYVVWRDYRDPRRGCYFSKSTDGGNSFSISKRVSHWDCRAESPSIAVDDSNGVYVAWEDYGWGPTSKIIFGYSDNAGDTFIQNIRVDDAPGWAQLGVPTLCINERKEVFIAWEDDRNDPSHFNPDIYITKGTKEMPEISEVLSFKKKNFLIFGNPTKNLPEQLYLKPTSFKIYDIKGSLVGNEKNKYKKLKKGIYFLIFDKKIIKIINIK